MKKVLSTLLCCLLLASMVFSLVACPAADPTPTPGPNPGPGENDDPPVGPGGNDDPPTPPVTDPVYGEGGTIADTGAVFADGAFAAMDLPFGNDGSAVSGDAVASALAEGTVGEYVPYAVTGVITVSGAKDVTLDGKLATLLAPEGLVLTGAENVTLSNLLISGPISLINCKNVTLSSVCVKTAGTALSVDADSTGIVVNDCQISGATAIANKADDLLVKASVLNFTETGLLDTAATGTTVYMSSLSGTGTAIRSSARETYIRRNTIACETDGAAVVLDAAPQTPAYTLTNGFVAENVITGAKFGVALNGQRNASVVLNTMKSVKVTNSHAVYVCSNALGGRLEADTVDYLLADENTYPADELDHTAVQKAVTNQTGDTVTDLTEEMEYGANEALLPHVDKELFVGEPAKASVKDPAREKTGTASAYISSVSNEPGPNRILVAPGKYGVTSAITISGANGADTDVYAYGVYAEKQNGLGALGSFSGTSNVTIRGIILAFQAQSCGQAYVIEKLSNNRLHLISGAGMLQDFGKTKPGFFTSDWIGAEHGGDFYAFRDANYNSIEKQPDGTMIMTVEASLYESMNVGDLFTCREVGSATTCSISNSTGVVFRDLTMYGNAGGFAFVEGSNRTATTYYRVLNSTRGGEIITKEEYDYYKNIESSCGISTDISIDEFGRYRGSIPHIGSIDATHTTRCAQGSVAKFCTFENMCDDATNQNHNCARLHGYKINTADNTVTLTYKSSLSEYSYEQGTRTPGGLCTPFEVGDRVYVYTSSGCLVCDGPALSASKSAGTTSGKVDASTSISGITLFEVTVAAESFHEEALNTTGLSAWSMTKGRGKIDNPGTYKDNLNDNCWYDCYKVLVDNMSMASNGFTFENCFMQNIRSRGLLIKASEGLIDHCTFKNIGMACAAILYEIYWGESGVTENMTVSNNLFDHTGYFKNQDRYAPIAVEGLGSQADENYLLYKNIVVEHNKIINRTTTYAFFINSAKDVVIRDNWVDLMMGEEEDILNNGKEPYSKIAHIIGAKNVKFEGNYYKTVNEKFVTDITQLIVGENFVHVYGSDVEKDGVSLIPDCVA